MRSVVEGARRGLRAGLVRRAELADLDLGKNIPG